MSRPWKRRAGWGGTKSLVQKRGLSLESAINVLTPSIFSLTTFTCVQDHTTVDVGLGLATTVFQLFSLLQLICLCLPLCTTV
jgi:hypothetical protein